MTVPITEAGHLYVNVQDEVATQLTKVVPFKLIQRKFAHLMNEISLINEDHKGQFYDWHKIYFSLIKYNLSFWAKKVDCLFNNLDQDNFLFYCITFGNPSD